MVTALVLAILLVAAMATALWYQRQQFEQGGREIATRMDQITDQLQQVRADARQALSLAQVQAGRVAALENSLGETQERYVALEQALQNLNDSGGEAVLANDIERSLTLANQQLRLAGNVSNAIVALETAQNRLAQADRPRFASLQQAINGDLDRLRAVPLVDVPVLAGRVDRLIGMVDSLPLLASGGAVAGRDGPSGASNPSSSSSPSTSAASAPPPAGPAAADVSVPPDAAWWQRWHARVASWPGRVRAVVANEMGDLIQVQRVAEPGALLLSPQEGEQLRTNLRQRLLTAQVALLVRQSAIWHKELDTVAMALATRFDTQAADSVAAARLARELADTRVAVPVPEITNSLNALAALRSSGSRPAGRRD